MGFCTLCGREVPDGEVCTCQQQTFDQNAYAPTEGTYTAPVEGAYTAPVEGAYTAPVEGAYTAPVEGAQHQQRHHIHRKLLMQHLSMHQHLLKTATVLLEL